MADISIIYNGSTISELSATGTKTLNTKNTFCKSNIAVQYVKPTTQVTTVNSDSWEKDENNILVLNQSSGQDTYSHLGKNAQLIKTISKTSVALKDTDYNTWTPSTSAKSIVASSSAGTQALNLTNYEYVVRWLFDAKIQYTSGTTKKAAPVRQIIVLEQFIVYKPTTFANVASGTDDYGTANTVGNSVVPFLDYYTSTGTHSITQTISTYGFYPTAASQTLSSTSSTTPTLTLKTPQFNARCSTSYFSTTMGSAVDKTNSVIELTGWLYQVDRGTSLARDMAGILYSTYNS